MLTQHFKFLLTLVVALGCSGKRNENGVVSPQRAGAGATSACDTGKTVASNLNVAPPDSNGQLKLKNPNDPSLGMGYWDAISTAKDGSPVSRRCTINLQPHPSKSDVIIVYTAKHCGYAPQSHEFANARNTFNIWADGGYFSVEAVFENKSDFGKFAAGIEQFAELFGKGTGVTEKWDSETVSGGTNGCIAETTNAKSKVMAGHRLACVSSEDLVNLEARVNVPEKYKPIFDEILRVVSARSNNLSGINARDRELLVALQSAKNAQLILHHALRELAFGFNANFCAAPAGHKVTLRKDNEPLWQGPWCKNPTTRELLIADIRRRLSEELYNEHMKSIIEMPVSTDYSDSSAIVALHDQIWGCHIENLSQVQANQVAKLNACDRTNFKRLMWKNWMAEYKTRLGDFPPEKKNLFGLNTATYFTLGVNALPSQAAVDANDHSKSLAKIFSLPTETRFIQFGSGALEQTLLLSFSPASEQMFFTKKDSGSLLSVLGSVPFAALSTIDGEATSGGASITPLPRVEGDEEEELPARRGGGC